MDAPDGATLRAIADYWTGLADQYEDAGPIETALRGGCISDELHQTTWYAAHRAELAGIDPTPLLAFVERPSLDALVAARTVVMRLSLKPNQARDVDDAASVVVRGNEPPWLLTVKQAAERAKVDEKTIRRMIKNGSLKATQYGTGSKRKKHRIDPADLATVEQAEPAHKTTPTPPRPRRQRGASSASAFLPRVQ